MVDLAGEICFKESPRLESSASWPQRCGKENGMRVKLMSFAFGVTNGEKPALQTLFDEN